MKLYHVYEDWTLEETPRCFYVGKGDDNRVAKLKRQSKPHRDVAQTLGQRRVVVFSTEDEALALERERAVIQERHVHPRDSEYNGIGCNRTLGGQGNSGRIVSEETCRRISEAKKGKTPNKVWTQTERDVTSRRMSELHKGKMISDEHRQALRERMADPELKQEMIEKVSQALLVKNADPSFHQHIVETRARGESSGQARLSEKNVKEMRQAWAKIDLTQRGSADDFYRCWSLLTGVTTENVRAVVTRKTWRHLS